MKRSLVNEVKKALMENTENGSSILWYILWNKKNKNTTPIVPQGQDNKATWASSPDEVSLLNQA